MQNFSFFEVVESQASMVMKALNKVTLNKGRKVIVEIAGENTGKSDKSGKKRGKESVREEKQPRKRNQIRRKEKDKPSREERGYTAARGPKKKDDWKQFFQNDNRPLRGEEPDFAEEGWAKRSKRKNKNSYDKYLKSPPIDLCVKGGLLYQFLHVFLLFYNQTKLFRSCACLKPFQHFVFFLFGKTPVAINKSIS